MDLSIQIIEPRPFEPKDIDGLLVSPGKACPLMTDHLITGQPLRSDPAQENGLKSNHPYIQDLLAMSVDYI